MTSRLFQSTAPGWQQHAFDVDDAVEGARNLLLNCAGLIAGQHVYILAEDPSLGWYDGDAPRITAELARQMGANVTVAKVGGPETKPDAAIQAASELADIRIFFARIGDQARFSARPKYGICVMVYARTAAALASDYGRTPHHEMLALKDRVNDRLFSATSIRLSCPLGTSMTGTPPQTAKQTIADVTVHRFPMCMPAPMPASAFSGQVALAGYITPTGSESYNPASLKLETVVLAHVERGRILGYDGPSRMVEAIHRHYHDVSSWFQVDPDVVHSWHAGIHAGCTFTGLQEDDPDLWANSVFGHPGYLHFHTCGDYAPGEICWTVANPVIELDGQMLWSDGHLHSN